MSATATADGQRSRRIAANAAVLVLLRLLTPALSVGVVLAVSRLLGREELGRYTLAFAYLQVCLTIAPFGLYALLARDGARTPARLTTLLRAAMTLGTASGSLLALILCGIALAMPYDAATRQAVMLLSIALVPGTLNTLFEAAFVALERMQWIAIAALCENAVKLGGAVVALALGYGLPAVLLAAVAGAVAGSLVSASRLRALGVRVGWSAELAPLRELARAAPTFLFIALFATLYWRIDLFMLAQMRDMDAVGAYGAAWRLLELSLILPQSVCLAIYPQLAAAGADTRLLARLGGTSLRLLLAAALPLAVGISVLAPQVIGLLYGAQFASAAPTLAVLIWTLIPYLWVRLHAYVLVAADHQHVDLALNVAMTVLNVALNLVLIPPYGHWGAALATLITMLAYGAAQYAYLVWALPGRAAPLQIPLPALLGGIAMGAVLWTLRAQSLLTTVAAAAVLYGAALVASGITAGGGRRFDLAKVWRQFDGARS